MEFPDTYFEVCEKANDCRRRWNINENDPIDIFSVVLNKVKNVTIIFLDMDGYISGSSYKTKGQNIIFINSNHPLGRQRFTLAHELYHLLYEDKFIKCDMTSSHEIEEMANQFASCLLMSNGALLNYERENNIEKWDLDAIISTEQFFQISHKAMLRRLLMLDKITDKEYDDLLPGIIHNARQRGYSDKLYRPYVDNDNFIMGNYIKLINQTYEDNLISEGKRDELLINSFNEDLINYDG
ncbi:MAG: ImmA/IrrE family metallo-endopeptidase [Methanosphaera sp.]|nr:ImmA/IrrE family metallo-endopeptidase [Methanosphaera sp.]